MDAGAHAPCAHADLQQDELIYVLCITAWPTLLSVTESTKKQNNNSVVSLL